MCRTFAHEILREGLAATLTKSSRLNGIGRRRWKESLSQMRRGSRWSGRAARVLRVQMNLKAGIPSPLNTHRIANWFRMYFVLRDFFRRLSKMLNNNTHVPAMYRIRTHSPFELMNYCKESCICAAFASLARARMCVYVCHFNWKMMHKASPCAKYVWNAIN